MGNKGIKITRARKRASISKQIAAKLRQQANAMLSDANYLDEDPALNSGDGIKYCYEESIARLRALDDLLKYYPRHTDKGLGIKEVK